MPTNDEFTQHKLSELAIPRDPKLVVWSAERVRKGGKVYKRGRTTGLTCGEFSHINPRVNLDGKVVAAWQVVGFGENDFCRPGDSGSFIIDSEGQWCALLFACPYTHRGDAYVLPVDQLIEDIEYITGGTVSLPA